MSKNIAWFSCGITSAVAVKLALQKFKEVEIYYFVIDSAHWDNERFIRDCEKWYNKKIHRVQGKYTDQFEVIRKERYINGPGGAKCTKELKKKLRQTIEKSTNYDSQTFGFEFTLKEINRAVRFAEQYPGAKPYYPLIENKLTKEQCAGILLKNGIELPEMYKLGFHNNNCIGCVKGGMGYWNKIREHFPSYFDRMSELETNLGRTCIKNKPLKDLKPNEGKHEKPILPDCGNFCEVEFTDIIDQKALDIYNEKETINQLRLF